MTVFHGGIHLLRQPVGSKNLPVEEAIKNVRLPMNFLSAQKLGCSPDIVGVP